MSESKLIFKDKISRRNSQEMILMMAKFSKHSANANFRSDADVKRFFLSRHIDFQQVVENCRIFKNHVPFFENLVGSTWEIPEGGNAALVDKQTGEVKISIQGPGELSTSTYWHLFEYAIESRNKTVELSSNAEFQSAITKGIASIEAYFNYRAGIWNSDHHDVPLFDSSSHKVSFDDKIDNWIPQMTGGKKFDKSIRNWNDFKTLKQIRDNLYIHPKNSAYGISYKDLSELINLFRTGIAGILIQLHLLFNEIIPPIIIRGFYSPDVEIITI